MKKLITAACILFAIAQIKLSAQTNTFPLTGSAGVGTITPNASSIVEMQSTTQGLLAPRMTKVQRDAIVAPATGLLIFQTNSAPGFYYYSGAAWTAISTKGANTSLSNLAAGGTSINQTLKPNANNTLDLGSSLLNWNELYVNSIKFMDGTTQTTAGGGGGATYTAGSGIDLTGTVISNTGDINAGDDVTTSTNHGGDITGLYNNLQIGSAAVGSAEIADASIAAADMSAMGAVPGQVMQWNGAAWVATTPAAGATYTAGTGISIAGSVITNIGDTNGADDVTTATNHSGDVTGLYNNLQIGSGAVGSTEIADGTVSTTDILNGTIAAADLNSMGALSGQVMQWNGTAWVATTPTAGAETDPQVGAMTTDKVARWDGTALINSGITDNGDNMAVGWDVVDANASGIFYNAEGIFAEEDIALKGVDHTVSVGGVSTVNAYANIGYNTTGMIFLDAPVSHVGVWPYIPSTSTGNGAAVYAQNASSNTSNYAIVARSTGAGTTNYGLWAKASGATNNYALIVPSDGGNTGFGTETPNVRLHVNGLLGSDAFRVQVSGSTKFLVQSNGGASVGSLTTAPTNGLYVSGDVRIGSATAATGYKMSVDGKIMCEELKVQLSPWPDYVFAETYSLKTLEEVESFIQINNHLPNIPPATQIESEGLNVGEMQGRMMEKIEELTLYVIELNKINKELQSRIETLESK